MWTDWLDLPKLNTLRTIDYISSDRSYTFRYPHHITLEGDSHPQWMMFRHAQSHRCVSSICILLQEWRHNQRKYSLHPSLTNRHRSSSKLLQLITERHVTPLCATHNYFPSTSELIQGHLRERYRCANTEIMTTRIWNDGNPIRIVGTTTNDHSLQIAWNQHQTMLQITHIASTLKSESNPNQANPLSQTQKHRYSLSFHSYNPLNSMKSESSPSSGQSKSIIQTQLPHINISLQQLRTQSAFESTHNHSNSKNCSPITISIPL